MDPIGPAVPARVVTVSRLNNVLTDDDVTEPPDPTMLTDVTVNVYAVSLDNPVNEYEV